MTGTADNASATVTVDLIDVISAIRDPILAMMTCIDVTITATITAMTGETTTAAMTDATGVTTIGVIAATTSVTIDEKVEAMIDIA
jgi:hypothetical protein